MKIEVQPKPASAIAATPVVQQTGFWSAVKQQQGIAAKAYHLEVNLPDKKSSELYIDDVLVLYQQIARGYYLGYVPYGPKLNPGEEHQGRFLEMLSESLRPYVLNGCISMRYDLKWESPWAKDADFYDENNTWLGPPEKHHQELRINFNTNHWNLRKSNTNILPTDTIFIDLRKDEDTLLANMKRKTRYNIRLSLKKGIKTRIADIGELGIWHQLYRETTKRNGIFLHAPDYFKAVLNARKTNTRSSAHVEMLIAEYHGKPLAAMFLVITGHRATYLYGASSSENRNLMAPYALQWKALQRAKELGCTEYDMFGTAPNPNPTHPLYGLYRFKKGFGGQMFHRMGCWDYPLQQKKYNLYLAAEMNSQGYHLG
jgi:lipid II:glycine glycyltransferase (peptidoglycan interpeptide bridge formation enzyme)